TLQALADERRDPPPPVLEEYSGPATIETYTVHYGRDGEPLQGVVILRTPSGERTMARVVPRAAASLSLLTSWESSAVGVTGEVRNDAFGKPTWIADSDHEGKSPRRQYTTVERRGRVTIVTINRPEAMNALHPPANAELAEIMSEFEQDAEQWVAIVTGAGDRAFCSGNDLKYFSRAMANGEQIEEPALGYAGLTANFEISKPVIAAVNGVAMGGGFEIALACDLIVASDSAEFALPEPKVGLAALAGGLLRLPRQIGLKQAMGMILTGRTVGAREAKSLGFVNEVTTAEQLMDCALSWAERIAACSPMSIRASKQIVNRGLDELSVMAAYTAQSRYPATKALFRSADLREGPRAFAEKRPPQWTGR
ncbi:MAG: enoyl-CoA hydratase-related protein, partial [Parahaliea sp.]